jgi:hypothetical protein
MKELWLHDHLQFARLLSELEVAGAFDAPMLAKLREQMDLTNEELMELLDRAQRTFDRSKRGAPPALSNDGTCSQDYDLVAPHERVWIGVKGISVCIVDTGEGVVVDLFANGREYDGSIASTYASYNEAEVEDE